MTHRTPWVRTYRCIAYRRCNGFGSVRWLLAQLGQGGELDDTGRRWGWPIPARWRAQPRISLATVPMDNFGASTSTSACGSTTFVWGISASGSAKAAYFLSARTVARR